SRSLSISRVPTRTSRPSPSWWWVRSARSAARRARSNFRGPRRAVRLSDQARYNIDIIGEIRYDEAFNGAPSMPSSAPCPNRRQLDQFVQAHLELAGALAVADGGKAAAARLERWAEHLHGLIGVVAGPGPMPAHLE